MKPLETLRNEHGLIRQFLDNLALAVEKMEDGRRPPREFFERAVRFAKDFADTYHHIKEEHIMFVRLAQKHGGELDGQIDALRHQHETGRDYITEINSSLTAYEEDNPVAISRILESMAAYIAMLRAHIHHEDHVVFPMAIKQLTDEEQEQLQAEFDRARDKAGETTFEDYHKLVVDMGSMLVHL